MQKGAFWQDFVWRSSHIIIVKCWYFEENETKLRYISFNQAIIVSLFWVIKLRTFTTVINIQVELIFIIIFITSDSKKLWQSPVVITTGHYHSFFLNQTLVSLVRSGWASSNVVGIICPLGWNRVNWTPKFRMDVFSWKE